MNGKTTCCAVIYVDVTSYIQKYNYDKYVATFGLSVYWPVVLEILLSTIHLMSAGLLLGIVQEQTPNLLADCSCRWQIHSG